MRKYFKFCLFTLIFILCFSFVTFASTQVDSNFTLNYTSGQYTVFRSSGSLYACRRDSNHFYVYSDTSFSVVNCRADGSVMSTSNESAGLKYYTFGGTPVSFPYQFPDGFVFTNDNIIEYMTSPDGEDLDMSSSSTLEGYNELGFVGGWGERRNVLNNVFNGHTYATLEMDNFGFNSVTVDGTPKYDLSTQGYDELYIQFAYKGFGTYWIQGSDGSIAQCPITTSYDIWHNAVPSGGHYGGDYTSLNSDGLLSYSTFKTSYSFKRPLFEWFNNMIAGRGTEQYNFNNALGSYFKGNFSLSARYIALQDGHYIYGPWTDSYSELTDKDNKIPSDPKDTVNKKPTTVVRVEPTDNPEIDIPHEITLPNNDTTIYFPDITISPDGDGDGQNDVTVNVTVNDINGNIVSDKLLDDNTLDTSKLTEWTTQLVESVKNVPIALSSLFSFFPDWVLNMYVVAFGVLIIFAIINRS